MIRTLICCAMSLLVSALPSPPADDRPHLAVALDAARFIQASAVATPHGTTWPANPADRASVAADLYSGCAGVVLFFLELHRATGDPGAPRDGDRRRRRAARLARSPGRRRPLHRARRHRLRAERSRRGTPATAKYRDGARRVVALLQAAGRRDAAPASSGTTPPTSSRDRRASACSCSTPPRRSTSPEARDARGARRTPAARARPRRGRRPQVADGRHVGAAAAQLLARHRRRRLLPGDALPGDEGPRVPRRRARRRRLPEGDRARPTATCA